MHLLACARCVYFLATTWVPMGQQVKCVGRDRAAGSTGSGRLWMNVETE